MGITSLKSVTTPGVTKSKGVVVTKTARGIKVIDNGVVRMQFKVISKAEMKQYQHPVYKPLIP